MAMESKRKDGGESMREGKKMNFGPENLKKNNYSKHNNMTEGCQKTSSV